VQQIFKLIFIIVVDNLIRFELILNLVKVKIFKILNFNLIRFLDLN